MSVIPFDEVEYSSLSLLDDVGRVFRWKGQVYRAILHGSLDHIMHLFDSGLVNELADCNLIPASAVSEHTLNGFGLVLQHANIENVTYPHEWSFDMYRDAALMVLSLSETAAKHGFTLKDCHPYNVLFNGVEPIFVDIGSLVKNTDEVARVPMQEFLSWYLYPLSIWARGDRYLAQRVINSAHEGMPAASWDLYQQGSIEQTSVKGTGVLREYAGKALRHCRRRAGALSRRIGIYRHHQRPRSLTSQCGEVASLRAQIERLTAPPNETQWQNYHEEYFQRDSPASTTRFDRVLELVRSFRCQSAIEIAGNQGLLSLLMLQSTEVRTVVCTDYDAGAINRLYRRCRSSPIVPPGKLLTPAIVNFVIPELNFSTEPPDRRFVGDIVLALAVTHHLTLTQGFRINDIIRKIAAYTRQYALIEFMPMGLWNGTTAPNFPVWYNEHWFSDAFAQYFEVLGREEVEANRVLYIGRLKREK